MACSTLAKGGLMTFRSAVTKSNDAIALKMTIAFGSIWCVLPYKSIDLADDALERIVGPKRRQ